MILQQQTVLFYGVFTRRRVSISMLSTFSESTIPDHRRNPSRTRSHNRHTPPGKRKHVKYGCRKLVV